MIYKHKNIHFSTDNPLEKVSKYHFLSSADNYAVNFFKAVDRVVYPDYTFAEVTRVSSACMSKFFDTDPYNEGEIQPSNLYR